MESVTYARSFWAALLTFAGGGSVSFGGGRWSVRNGSHTHEVAATAITAVRVRPGVFWSTLELVAGTGVVRFGGLAHRAADHLHGVFTVAAIPPRVAEALATWEAAGRRRYLNHYAWAGWRERQAGTREMLRPADLQWLPSEERVRVARFIETFDKTEEVARKLNEEHLARELRECKSLFDSVEKSPLTRMQRAAVVTDEDNTLVVAGAGTGKTSVVVAKVAYAVKRLGVKAEELLLLAYNNKAAEEMKERVAARAGVAVVASTFHSLGMRIIGQGSGAKPALSKLAEDGRDLKFVEDVVRAMLLDPRWRNVLLPYLVEYLKPCRGPEEFKTQHEFVSYLKGNDIVSLRGEQVRSHEECTIANWLFANGIEYAYERDYEHDTRSSGFRQYRPDFYLVESGIYLEHFGVGHDGSTAQWVPREKYHEGMKWKRDLHRRMGTRLVETFSADRMDGLLTQRLAERLAAVGVRPKPRPPAELERVLEERGSFSVLARVATTFLHHFKEGLHDLAALRASTPGKEPRGRSFLDVFEHVYAEYQGALRAEGAIDFTDMIRLATEIVVSGRYRSPYSRVVIDEFQDTSRGRASLVKALLDQVPDRRLMCVGDDWQSIYRFAGSDIAHMTRFADHFGHAATVSLDETFRFGKRLLNATATFVQKNPSQLRKVLKSARDESAPAVVVLPLSASPGRDREASRRLLAQDVRAVLERIDREHTGSETAFVYLLGRYNHNMPDSEENLSRGLARLKVEFLSVHRSKGREADYVVVIEAVSGKWGFPSQVEDDPLLAMVLAAPDPFEHAEERRLFYVALTRAKRRVFVLTREATRSVFVEELLKPEYAGLVEAAGEIGQVVPCGCGGSMTRRRNSNDGSLFWSCADYPYCDGRADVCHVCQRGAMVQRGLVFRCSEAGCPGNVEVCPQCREGRLVEKPNSRDGSKFLGCSRYRRDKTGCSYTQNIGGPAHRDGFTGRHRR
jgi:DNA helicase-4